MPTEASSGGRLRVASVESLVCAAIVLGLFVISIREEAFGGSASYRDLGLAVAGCVIAAAIIQSLGRPRANDPRGGTGREPVVIMAVLYFGWAGAQDYFMQSDLYGATQSVIGLLLTCAAIGSDLDRIIAGLRRWLPVALVAFLIPAFTADGFEVGERVWLSSLPGRYFGFSNPNGLATIAGLALLLAIPALRQGRCRVLALLGASLLVLTAGYTALFALGAALVAYVGLARVTSGRLLSSGVGALALATPAVLLWLPTDHALRFLADVQARFDLSGRSYLWVHLVRLTRDSGSFWTGLGDQKVAYYTVGLLDVYSAHSTILQLLLAGGFVTAVLFVLVAAGAAMRLLGAWASERTQETRLACAVVVYWFVVSLASTMPGTGLGLSLVIVLAVAGIRRSHPGSAATAPESPQAAQRPTTLVRRDRRSPRSAGAQRR